MKTSWFLLLACLLPGYLEAARILALFPIPSPSHYFFGLSYLKKLASLGHEITSVNPFPLKEPVENIYDVPVPEVFDNFEEILKSVHKPKSLWKGNDFINEYTLNLTRTVLSSDGVRREILSPGKAQFDLVIADLWRLDALYGLAATFEAPIIGLAPYGTDWKIDGLVGNISPMSYIQSPSSNLYDLKTFRGRLSHFLDRSIAWMNWSWRHRGKQETLYRKYFPKIADKQPLSEISRNYALIFVNQHFTLSSPRSYVPNMIEVGGLHIDKEPKPLSQELEEFIQGAGENGVIYFSLGTNVRSKSLSQDLRKVLMDTFANLPQRVLWKFDDDQLPGKPSNVFISKWFPQQDILAHPKVKLFITHGGLLSTIESIHYGKPMLGLPCFFDQFNNMEHVKSQGLGLVLNLKKMTSQDFNSTVLRLLTEKSFEEAARARASLYRDRPMKPLETAIWWTEYILRHKGATHMRVAGRELDFFTYHSLDVLGTFLLGFLAILGMFSFCVVKAFQKCLRYVKEEKKLKLKIR
ncbi:UDP-glucosyltransferase 2 [Drosophila kikkawai]|uniref:UDP-glucuronosyltransferase n=1 Tax=Drosophila kikkawai TaxID=30033 RepID=A0A6P4JA32_DROKI|nr:UDP-glucosyltransferase 2 [Drosophila kikkawai]